MALSDFVFALVLTFLSHNISSPSVLSQARVNPIVERERLEAFSVSVADAIKEHPDDILFVGPARQYAVASVLATIGFHESGYDARVERCLIKGDNGRSITSFQVMKPWVLMRRIQKRKVVILGNKKHTRTWWEWVKVFTEKQVCNSTKIAAGQSLQMFAIAQRECKGDVAAGFFAAYGTGSCSKKIKVTNNVCYLWQRASKRIGLSGVNCWKNLSIDFVDKEYTEELVEQIIKK